MDRFAFLIFLWTHWELNPEFAHARGTVCRLPMSPFLVKIFGGPEGSRTPYLYYAIVALWPNELRALNSLYFTFNLEYWGGAEKISGIFIVYCPIDGDGDGDGVGVGVVVGVCVSGGISGAAFAGSSIFSDLDGVGRTGGVVSFCAFSVCVC